MSEFNAKKARAKRPLPLWVADFLQKTMHLETDEFGAYHRILYAMWTRETCDFPNDERRLARVSGVSTRLWKSRIGPAILPFFDVDGDMIISDKLRKEASYVERHVTQQSNRKKGENSDKSLKNNDPPPTVDATVDKTTEQPTQQPNNLTTNYKHSRRPTTLGAGDDDFVLNILENAGFDFAADGKPESHWRDPKHKELVLHWIAKGLTKEQIIIAISKVLKKPNCAKEIGSLKYFDAEINKAIADKPMSDEERESVFEANYQGAKKIVEQSIQSGRPLNLTIIGSERFIQRMVAENVITADQAKRAGFLSPQMQRMN